MGQFLIVRAAQSVVTILLVTVIIFAVTRISGDPAELLIPGEVPTERLDEYRAQWGLDDPIVVQYFRFLGNAATGDLGESFRFDQPVSELLLNRLPATLKLAAAAMAITIVVAIPLGVVAAIYRGTPIDTIAQTLALVGQGVPAFWLGLILVLIFSVNLGWFPAAGDSGLTSLILPAISLSAFAVAVVTRLTRSSMLDVLDSEYIKLARAKGLSEAAVIFKHALRNASIPIITVLGLQLGLLLSGSVVVETIFNWPGIGRLAVDAIFAADYTVVQGVVLFGAIAFVLINLGVDLLYAVLDPRIRY